MPSMSRTIVGSPAEIYLRERGIRGELPPSLRYAVLKHTDTGLMLPAMHCTTRGAPPFAGTQPVERERMWVMNLT